MANMTSVKTFFNYFYILYLEFKILLYVCKTNMTNMKNTNPFYTDNNKVTNMESILLQNVVREQYSFTETNYSINSGFEYDQMMSLTNKGIVTQDSNNKKVFLLTLFGIETCEKLGYYTTHIKNNSK